MGRSKTVYVITSENIGEIAARVAKTIKGHTKDDPIPRPELADQTALTVGQLATIIKYMRRCALDDLEKFIRWYPISCKKGYFFAEEWRDFLPCYATLIQWVTSLNTSITPMRIKMEKEGIDWRDYIQQKSDKEHVNYLDDLPEINGDTSWFYERED